MARGRSCTLRPVFSPKVRFEGFTATDWVRFLSLFQPRRVSDAERDPSRPRGGVIGSALVTGTEAGAGSGKREREREREARAGSGSRKRKREPEAEAEAEAGTGAAAAAEAAAAAAAEAEAAAAAAAAAEAEAEAEAAAAAAADVCFHAMHATTALPTSQPGSAGSDAPLPLRFVVRFGQELSSQPLDGRLLLLKLSGRLDIPLGDFEPRKCCGCPRLELRMTGGVAKE